MLENPLFWSIALTGIAIVRALVRRESQVSPYRTFWPRFWSGWVDATVLAPVGLLDDWVAGSGVPWSVRMFSFAAAALTGHVYEVICLARWGQTFGKWVLGVQVVDVTETPLRAAQALRRSAVPILLVGVWVVHALMYGIPDVKHPSKWNFAVTVSMAWGVLEIVTMLWSAKRRALHDLIAGSVVIRVMPLRRRATA